MKNEVTIKKNDIMDAVVKLTSKGELADLFKEAPLLILIMPLIANELENALFEEEDD